jgi:thymidylate kinase
MLIVFEGLDKTHKTTTLNNVKKFLESKGLTVGVYHGHNLVDPFTSCFYKLDSNFSTLTLFMFFLANRSHSIDTVLKPMLKDCDVVLCDRYWYFTYAYQINSIATGNIPNLTKILLNFNIAVSIPKADKVFYFYHEDLPKFVKEVRKGKDDLINSLKTINTAYRNILNSDEMLEETKDKHVYKPVQKLKSLSTKLDKQTKCNIITSRIMELLKNAKQDT